MDLLKHFEGILGLSRHIDKAHYWRYIGPLADYDLVSENSFDKSATGTVCK
jgi:hypothetical protein